MWSRLPLRVGGISEEQPSDHARVGRHHASFNESSEPVLLQVIIGALAARGTGYGLVDVSGKEPRASLRGWLIRGAADPYFSPAAQATICSAVIGSEVTRTP